MEVGGAPFTPTLIISIFVVVTDHAIVVVDGYVAVVVDWCDVVVKFRAEFDIITIFGYVPDYVVS